MIYRSQIIYFFIIITIFSSVAIAGGELIDVLYILFGFIVGWVVTTVIRNESTLQPTHKKRGD